MNNLAWLEPGPATLRLALGVALQITLVTLAAELAARAWLRHRAAARHHLWRLALVCAAAAPAAWIAAGQGGLSLLPANTSATEPIPVDWPVTEPDAAVAMPSPFIVATPAELSPLAEPPMFLPAQAPAARRPSVPSLASFLYLMGVLFGVARLAIGARRAARVRRSMTRIDHPRLPAAIEAARIAANLSKTPPVFESPAVPGPIALGWPRPAIVLPAGLADELPAGPLRDVLTHEAAHLARGDRWVALAQRLAAVAYWPIPPIHLLNARLDRAREESCDDLVLERGDRHAYARTLLTLTRRCHPTAQTAGVGLIGRRWPLSDRIAGLIDPRRNPMPIASRRAALPGALLIAVAALAGASARRAEPVPITIAAPDTVEAPPTIQQGDAAPPAIPTAEVTLRGVVVDEQGRPVSGATVRSLHSKAGPPVATAADGTFAFDTTLRATGNPSLVATNADGSRQGMHHPPDVPELGDPAPARIVLTPAQAVEVLVTDGKDQPVRDASVELLNQTASLLVDRTDDRGIANVLIPSDARVSLAFALKDGIGFEYVSTYRPWLPGEDGTLPDRIGLALRPSRTVKVRAIDSEGRPVAGVDFAPLTLGTIERPGHANLSGARSVRSTTDADGVASFHWIPQRSRTDLGIRSSDRYSCPQTPLIEETGDVEVTARLLRATPLGGRVRDAEGNPIAGEIVQAEGKGNSRFYFRRFTRTAADGSYRFDAYPDQTYIVALIDEKLAAGAQGIMLREDQARTEIDLTATPGTRLHGRVTTEQPTASTSGAIVTLIHHGPDPLPDGQRYPSSDDPSLVRWTQTDADGRYSFRAIPGRYTLFLQSALRIEPVEITVDSGVAEQMVDLPLDRPPIEQRVVRVVVTDQDGQPVPMAQVNLEPINFRGAGAIVAEADSEGRFEARLAFGASGLFARDPAGKLAGFLHMPADLTEVRIELKPASRISGRVVDAAGKPLSGVLVQVLQPARDRDRLGQHYRTTRTDAEGRYAFDGLIVGLETDLIARRQFDTEGKSLGADHPIFTVSSSDPIQIPDLVIPSKPAAPQ